MIIWALFDSGNGSYDIKFQDWTKSYNERSNIPLSLVCEIFEKVYKEFMSET